MPSRCKPLYIQSDNYVGWFIKDRDGAVVADAVINLTVVDPVDGTALDGVTWPVVVAPEDVSLGLYSVVLPAAMTMARGKEYAGQLDIQSTGSGALFMETMFKARVKT